MVSAGGAAGPVGLPAGVGARVSSGDAVDEHLPEATATAPTCSYRSMALLDFTTLQMQGKRQDRRPRGGR